MPAPIKIRTRLQGDIAEIRVQLTHPMETGRRKDGKTGKSLPAHFIQSFIITINGKPLLSAQTGPSIARNPMFAVKTKGAAIGDKIVVEWTDNKGNSRSDESTIA